MKALNEGGATLERLRFGDIDNDMTITANTLKDQVRQYAGRVAGYVKEANRVRDSIRGIGATNGENRALEKDCLDRFDATAATTPEYVFAARSRCAGGTQDFILPRTVIAFKKETGIRHCLSPFIFSFVRAA